MTTFDLLVDRYRTFTVHKEGCRDVKTQLSKRIAVDHFKIKGEDVEDAIREDLKYYQECDMGYNRSHYKIAPCVHKKA